jgi:hypothetical protein
MAEDKKITKDQLVPTQTSVHVIYYSCPDCGEEVEEIKLCPCCNKPMRVINVVEKYGKEAEELLEKARKNTPKKEEEEEEYVGISKEEPNIILMGGDTNLDDGGIDPNADDENLDIIFPDENESEESHPKIEPVEDGNDGLAQALEQLDSEEDDTTAADLGFEDGDVPEL